MSSKILLLRIVFSTRKLWQFFFFWTLHSWSTLLVGKGMNQEELEEVRKCEPKRAHSSRRAVVGFSNLPFLFSRSLQSHFIVKPWVRQSIFQAALWVFFFGWFSLSGKWVIKSILLIISKARGLPMPGGNL